LGGGGGGGGGVFFRAGGTLLRPPLPKTGGATPSDLPANTRFFFFLRGCMAAGGARVLRVQLCCGCWTCDKATRSLCNWL